jgi:putative heme-binding domain-containing protein
MNVVSQSSVICVLLGVIAVDVWAQSIPSERRIRHREQSLTVYEPFLAEEMWNRIKLPPAPALSPAEALKSFEVAPGFRIETVAAEPLVEDPVAFEFDLDGRIWAVEMRGYMQDIDGSTEGDPIGQIVVLEDTDGDTFMDKSTVFLGGLMMARSVSFVQGGVLIQEPPNLWFCEDIDGDLKCDRKRLVGQFGRAGDPQHTDNSLFHALDNWIYNADSRVRYKFIDGKLVEEPTFSRGQWGMNQDDYGRLFYSYENRPLHVDLVPAELMYRNRHFQQALRGGRNSYGLNVRFSEQAREIYPIRVAPGITLGANELRDDGTLRTFTIAAGVSIYRGDQFPRDYYGSAVIPEGGGNLVRMNKLSSSDGVHLEAENQFGKREWIASTDERFRPVWSRTGPDGALYVSDMYKGIIEHVVFLMPYLRRYIEKQGLGQPMGMGRIYRIRHEGKPLGKSPKLSIASSAQLVQHLSHPNGWWRDTSQRLLIERKALDQVIALRNVVTHGQFHLGKLHAMWTLEGLGELDWQTVRSALRDQDAMVRATAARLSVRFIADGAVLDALDELTKVYADDRPMVRLQLLLALGAFRGNPRAEDMMIHIVTQHNDELFRASAVSGLEGREVEFIERLMAQLEWQSDSPGGRQMFNMLAMAAFNEQDADRISRLLAMASEQRGSHTWRRDALIDGILNSQFSRAKWPEPLVLPQRPELVTTLVVATDEYLAALGAQLARVVTWSGDTTVRPEKPNPRPLSDGERRNFALGRAIYAVTCHACHHGNGQGQEGKAPPLVESEWINGSPERLVRIALHGLGGPVKVHGREWNLLMPGLGQSAAFNDERMAAVLTYVRRAWDNWGDPIDPELVAQVRRQTAGRIQPWTSAELVSLAQTNTPAESPDTSPPIAVLDPLAKFRGSRLGGDPEQGRILFHTNLQMRCPACHIIGTTGGGFVGPALTDVGSRVDRNYLVESLIDPSAKIAKGYDTIAILTADGEIVSGTFVSESEEEVVIAPPAGGTVSIKLDEIDERFNSPISSMPPVAELFTPAEISDIVAYLASLKDQSPK